MKIEGRTVIVTGASSGIGLETAREFAKAGANVVLASRSKERLDKLAEELSSLPGQRLVLPTDVCDQQSVEAMIERTVEAFGSVDVLVNNAGLGLNASVTEGSLENMRYLLEVNVFGVIYGIQAVVPHMRKQGRGIIVNVSSVAGRIATPYNGIYCATKAALNSVSDALRAELAEEGIHVIAIYPGYTITDFRENALHEVDLPAPPRLLRGVAASAVARKIVQAVRQEQREAFVTFGDALAVTVKNLAPRVVDWGVRRLWLTSRPAKTAPQ